MGKKTRPTSRVFSRKKRLERNESEGGPGSSLDVKSPPITLHLIVLNTFNNTVCRLNRTAARDVVFRISFYLIRSPINRALPFPLAFLSVTAQALSSGSPLSPGSVLFRGSRWTVLLSTVRDTLIVRGTRPFRSLLRPREGVYPRCTAIANWSVSAKIQEDCRARKSRTRSAAAPRARKNSTGGHCNLKRAYFVHGRREYAQRPAV